MCGDFLAVIVVGAFIPHEYFEWRAGGDDWPGTADGASGSIGYFGADFVILTLQKYLDP